MSKEKNDSRVALTRIHTESLDYSCNWQSLTTPRALVDRAIVNLRLYVTESGQIVSDGSR